MKNNSRYPYTYAYDWVREAGLAKSRADAVTVVQKIAADDNVSIKEKTCQLADQYVYYYSTLEKINREKYEIMLDLIQLYDGILSGERT